MNGIELLSFTRARLTELLGARAEGPFVLGVSGGADSMALLEVLSRLLPGDRLTVAHFNHRLRAEESEADEKLVRERARQKGLRFVRAVGSGARRDEASLRSERRRFLRGLAGPGGLVLLAHHADDQLETFFLRLFRGTGMDGLSAMRPKRGVFVRPWLDLSRRQVRAWAEAEGVVFREDASNTSRIYARNRLRHECLPEVWKLAEEFGGREAFLGRFSGMLDELREASRLARRRARKQFQKHFCETPFFLRVRRASFLELPCDLRARCLRLAVSRLGAPAWSRAWVRRALGEIERGTRALSLPGRLQMSVSCGWLYLQNHEGRRALNGGISVESIVFFPEPPRGLELRFPRPGDRYGSRKLKRELLERGIPQLERSLLPVLARKGTRQIVRVFPDGGIWGEVRFPFAATADAARAPGRVIA